MSEYPDGWFRGTPGSGGAPGSQDPTIDVPARPRSGPPPRAQEPYGSAQPSRSRSAWPEQPPAQSGGRGGGPGYYGPGYYGPGGRGLRPRGARAWLRPRRILGLLAALVALILVITVGEYINLSGRLHHENVLVDYSGRPVQGSGTNWLIAGSDSRQGLTPAEEKALSTGKDIGGGRSDTIMVLHVPASGQPVLISLPRDSWVPIPGVGHNKLNAAFALGGPKLLAETVQNVTGLRIEHYMEIGFGGFVNVVNAVGGVHICLKVPLRDQASGLNLPAGCQTLNGGESLSYVRDRHDFAQQDLQRIQDQRIFLKALLAKLTSAGVLLNPFALIPAADGMAATVSVDSGTSLRQLASVAFSLKNPLTTTVPIANANFVAADGQDAVLWNRTQALALFDALNNGTAIPPGVITGSNQAS
jgi:LCP family protein required for cell wall assembly